MGQVDAKIITSQLCVLSLHSVVYSITSFYQYYFQCTHLICKAFLQSGKTTFSFAFGILYIIKIKIPDFVKLI